MMIADFVYDDHGKHDPFWPLVTPGGAVITYDADLTINDMTLEGVLADAGGKNLAIVNGKVVKVSDWIGSYQVGTITRDHVELRKGQEQFTLKLKKGGT